MSSKKSKKAKKERKAYAAYLDDLVGKGKSGKRKRERPIRGGGMYGAGVFGGSEAI